MKNSVYPYILTAFCAAIIAALAQVTIPLPLIPITGQTLAVGLVVTILGLKFGTYSVLLYVLLGAIGLPVFQGFSGGAIHLVGPTGGYIVGFIACSLVMGLYYKFAGVTFTHAVIANMLGMVVTLVFGAVWLKVSNNLSWTAAWAGGVAPFLVVGVVKGLIAAWVGVIVRDRLMRAHLLPTLA